MVLAVMRKSSVLVLKLVGIYIHLLDHSFILFLKTFLVKSLLLFLRAVPSFLRVVLSFLQVVL